MASCSAGCYLFIFIVQSSGRTGGSTRLLTGFTFINIGWFLSLECSFKSPIYMVSQDKTISFLSTSVGTLAESCVSWINLNNSYIKISRSYSYCDLVKMTMFDSQRYPRNLYLINNLKDIVVFFRVKKFLFLIVPKCFPAEEICESLFSRNHNWKRSGCFKIIYIDI